MFLSLNFFIVMNGTKTMSVTNGDSPLFSSRIPLSVIDIEYIDQEINDIHAYAFSAIFKHFESLFYSHNLVFVDANLPNVIDSIESNILFIDELDSENNITFPEKKIRIK